MKFKLECDTDGHDVCEKNCLIDAINFIDKVIK